jgi:hypothetical protein
MNRWNSGIAPVLILAIAVACTRTTQVSPGEFAEIEQADNVSYKVTKVDGEVEWARWFETTEKGIVVYSAAAPGGNTPSDKIAAEIAYADIESIERVDKTRRRSNLIVLGVVVTVGALAIYGTSHW